MQNFLLSYVVMINDPKEDVFDIINDNLHQGKAFFIFSYTPVTFNVIVVMEFQFTFVTK